MKADVDAAFRRIPIKPDERWMCGIAFMVDGQVLQSLLLVLVTFADLVFKVWWAQHLAAPFGATGSVHGWERVGAAAAHIARVLIKLAALRYVDDYFGPGRS